VVDKRQLKERQKSFLPLKDKLHYASWFEDGSKLVGDQRDQTNNVLILQSRH